MNRRHTFTLTDEPIMRVKYIPQRRFWVWVARLLWGLARRLDRLAQRIGRFTTLTLSDGGDLTFTTLSDKNMQDTVDVINKSPGWVPKDEKSDDL